ncbi:MAG: M10 family metallopeptidase C-terminal domain-containing protein [Beijerinckiaceae bacterium]
MLAVNGSGVPAGEDEELHIAAFDMPQSAFTFEMMLSLPANPGNSYVSIAKYGDASGSGADFAINPWSDRLDLFIAGVKFDSNIPTDAFVGSTPHRLSVAWDSATGHVKTWVDGVLVDDTILSGTIGKTLTGGRSLVLGAGGGADSTPEYSFGDVRVFDHMRSDAQIVANAGAELANPAVEPGLVAYWTADGTALASQVAGTADIVADTDIVNYARNARPATIDTGDLEVDSLIDGLLMDSIYTSGTVITYTFDRSSALPTDDGLNWQAINASMERRVREVLAQFTALTGVQCVEVDEIDQDANLFFASRDNVSTAYVTSHRGGIITVFNTNTTNPVPGTYADHLILHELGHAFALAHGHDTDALPAQYQGYDWSVMSYRGHPDSENLSFGPNHGPETWMLADVAAIQYQFGANFGSNGGNTTYTFDRLTGETFIDGVGQGVPTNAKTYRTIWDGGGTDTYDLSNFHSDLTIDLNPGRFTSFGDAYRPRDATSPAGDPLYASGNIANAYLYFGDTRSLIENAIGGQGDDFIIGNQTDNVLTGGAGADHIEGGAGADTLIGDGGSGAHGDRYGLAMNMNGATGQKLSQTYASSLPQTALTLDFTVNFESAPQSQWFLSLPGVSLLFDPGNSSAPGLWVLLDGAWTYSGIRVASLGDGQAHRITMSWDSATGAVSHYLDGVRTGGASNFKTGASLSGTGTVNVNPVNGAIGEIRLYATALDAAEIYGIDQIDGAANGLVLDWRTSATGAVTDAAGGPAPAITGTPGVVIVDPATPAADTLFGGTGNDTLLGVAGADVLDGGDGDDTLDVGEGDSAYWQQDAGKSGDDLYLVRRNSGKTVIGFEGEKDGGGADRVVFEDIALSDVTITHQDAARSVLLAEGNTRGGTVLNDETSLVTIGWNGGRLDVAYSGAAVEAYEFSDGFIVNHFVFGSEKANIVIGGAGVDFIDSGLGNDSLSGGAGNDVFSFSTAEFVSGGVDTIYDFHEAAGDTDILRLQGSASDYAFANVGGNLEVTHAASGARIVLVGFSTAQLDAAQVQYFA